MKSHQFIVIVLVSMFIGILSGYGQQTAEQQYQAGLYKEEIEGELDAAVKIYEKILRQYPDDRQVAAKTHLHIGICHEKLGNAAARKAYELVIREYADQAVIVSQAQKRLAALAVAARAAVAGTTKDLTLKKIYRGNAYAVSISPDRTRLAIIRAELSSRDIWIREIETGKEIRMTNHINTSSDIVWSPDNQWIAFADQDRDVKVVPIDGDQIRTLFTVDPNAQNTAGIAPTGWTSDSRKVIFQVPSKGLFAIPAAGGALESICTFENPDEAKRYEAMTLSPDGRWIAYSAVENGNTDIFIMSPVARIPVRLTTNPAADKKPRWSSDGNWLAFTSSGTENPQIWVIKISPKGEPDGVPVQISKDSHVLGGDWTGDESIGFSAAFRTEHIFTANIDGTGETQVTQFASFNTAPRWSPNGDRIAFRSDYRKPLNRFQLWIVPSVGGTPRLVSDKEVSDFLWSNDGEKLFFRTRTESNQSVSMEISSRGGEPKEIMPLPGEANGMDRSPDGQSIAYTFTIEPARYATTDEYLKERLSGIGIAPKGGGEPRILIPADKKGIWYSDCRLDPEGKRIAYIMFDYAQYNKEGMYSIWTMDVNGGAPRQIARGGEYHLCWSPDAKWIVFEKRIKDMEFELFKVPANGGEPVKMNIRGRNPEFSPDGKKIAYSRRLEGGYEYWLVENFAAQSQAKLAASVGTGGLVTQRILADASRINGSLTMDGKHIMWMDETTGDVVRFNVTNRQTSRIKNRVPWSENEKFNENQVFSRDGKQIVYTLFNREGGYQLRIRNLDGSGLRTLYTEKESAVKSLDWSPDGGYILALIERKTNNWIEELTLISTTDGSARTLRNIIGAWYLMEKASFSPDGQFVAFSWVQEGSPPHNDIFLMNVDGRNEVVVAGHPAEDQLLGWTPDGRNLAFLSDRSGTWDIWSVRITGGKQQGEPELLKKDFGSDSWALGLASNGSLYFKTYIPSGGLYCGSVDLETGKVVDKPVQVSTRYISPPSMLKWSPDGRSLAYISRPGRIFPGNNIVTIRSTTTGEERFLSPHLRYIDQLSWAPDGRTVIARGITETDNGIYRIDTETNEIAKLSDGVAPSLCPDGKTLVFGAQGPTIRKRNLDTGEESEIVKTGGPYDLSPDGREVVFQIGGAIKTVSLNGGEPQGIFRGVANRYDLAWTTDGRYIIAQAVDTLSSEIWRIPAEGGTPLKLKLNIPKMEFFALHPDNHRFAFSLNEGSRIELWVMENFLPMDKTKADVSAMTVTRVLGKADVTGKVSADGSFLTFTDWENTDVAIHDIATGQNRRLTDNRCPQCAIENSIPSPDSRSIAYTLYGNSSVDLCIVGIDGSKPRILQSAGNGVQNIIPLAWSPDSKNLLAEFVKTDGSRDMMLVMVADGSKKLLKSTGKDLSPGGVFSPDGRYIAWSTREGISLFDLRSESESLILQDLSKHIVLGWAPDGKYLMFSSERSGSSDAWLIAMAGGKTQGEPIFVKKEWGFEPMGFTRSGAFFYSVNNNVWDVKIAEFDPVGKNTVSLPQSVFRHGNMRGPDWSPDGRSLAAIAAAEPSQAVIIRSMDTEEEREIRTGGWTIGMGSLRWTPDGKAVVAPASEAGKGEYLIRIDVQSGKVTPMMPLPALGGWPRFAFSNDGNLIYYVRPDPKDPGKSRLVAHNLRSGEETIIRENPGIFMGKLSPDGRQLLIASTVDEGKSVAMFIIPVSGGEPRELVKVDLDKEVFFWGSLPWTPDGRHVIFLKGIKKEKQSDYKKLEWQLWRVAVEDGEVQPLGLKFTGQLTGPLRLNPDGRRVVIGDVRVNLEVWKMENFLPK